MVKDTQILIRLESAQKEKWEKHVENEDRYRNLTHFISSAVEDKISTDTEEYSPEDAIIQMSEEINQLSTEISDLYELNEKIDDTQATSMEMQESVDRLENIFKSRLDDE